MKTFKLIGRPLDVAVEMALQGGQLRPDYNPRYTPEHSADWSLGGPIKAARHSHGRKPWPNTIGHGRRGD